MVRGVASIFTLVCWENGLEWVILIRLVYFLEGAFEWG